MYEYVLVHEHRHGTSTYGLKSTRPLTQEDAIQYLGEIFEPNRDDEWIHLQKITFEEIQ